MFKILFFLGLCVLAVLAVFVGLVVFAGICMKAWSAFLFGPSK